MSSADDDKDVLAAEYVLGTLDADDRANARMLMAIDPEFAASVARWEQQFGELHALVDPVEPSPHNWEWIKARIAAVEPSRQIWMPSLIEAAAAPPPRLSESAETDTAAVLREPAKPAPVKPAPAPPKAAAGLAPSPRRWRALALLACMLALAVVGVAGLREFWPDMLPPTLQPTPVVVEKPVEVIREVIREVVREIPSQRIAESVAVFQEGGAPSFLLSVDLARKIVAVRRIGAKPADGQAHELWIMTPQTPQPRSLGVLDDDVYTVRPAPDGYDAPAIANATFGISREPAGGSPSGKPTGALLRAKLTQTIPSAFPAAAP